MKCQKYIARCYRVYQHERNENASFLSIFNGGGRPKWRFSNFPRFWKNSSALGSFNCIFENNSLKALFGQNMKKVKILKLSPDFWYLQTLALNTCQGNKKQTHSCVYCNKEDHMCANCPQVVTIRNCQKILTEKQLCFNCTSNNHKADSCRSGSCHNCQRKHHISICDHSRPNSGQFMTAQNKGLEQVIYPVVVNGVKCCALLDTGVGSSYTSSAILDHLGIRPIWEEFNVLRWCLGPLARSLESMAWPLAV